MYLFFMGSYTVCIMFMEMRLKMIEGEFLILRMEKGSYDLDKVVLPCIFQLLEQPLIKVCMRAIKIVFIIIQFVLCKRMVFIDAIKTELK